MRKTLLLLILILPLTNYGQIINLAPKIGDSYITQACYTKDITEGNTGKNQIWDMTQIKDSINSLPYKVTYINVKSTPFFSDFPTANLALKIPIPTMDTIISYYYLQFDKENNRLIDIGMKVGEPTNVTLKYEDEICSFQYPMSFGDKFQDTFYSDFKTFPKIPKVYGSSFSVADASGILKFQDGNYEVLRIKTINETYVIFSKDVFVKTNTISYTYYSPLYSFPLLTITYSNTQTIEKKKKKEKIITEKNAKIVSYSKPNAN